MGISQKILLFLLLFSFQVHAERINVDFTNLSLNNFIEMIGKITGKNILIDEKLNGEINYPFITSIEKSELIPLTRFFLQKEGYMFINKGYIYHVTKIESDKFYIESNFSNKEEEIISKPISIIPNISEAWKNIGVSEYKVDNKIKGFKINFIKKNSEFDKLGLKKGDILLSFNGKKLTSYMTIFSFYQEIDDIEKLNITIKRDNKIMELEYEIR